MEKAGLVTLQPAPWLEASRAAEPPVTEEFDPAALLSANLSKMHHHQSVSQWIRTWAFAIVGFSLGYAYAIKSSPVLLALSFTGVELILFIILLKDVEWHRMFWRYRDRARLCEAYLLGNIKKDEMRARYLSAAQPSRLDLLRDAFSPSKLFTISTDFMESYLMIGLALAFVARLVLLAALHR